MNKNYKSISEKDNQQYENCSKCNCLDQVDEKTSGNTLVNEKVSKKSSCC